MSADSRGGSRTFVRSLNILLKFARLYEFGHVRTAAQFEINVERTSCCARRKRWKRTLSGASGNQILLDGVPLGAAAGEKSFAQFLISSGIASIHFSPALSQAQFARFVRAFPSGNAKPSSLAEQLKSALAGETGIKVNEIRYVAEDSSVAGIKTAANLAAKVLGASGDGMQGLFDDPNRLLQMILAAESSRGGGGGAGGSASGGGSGSGAGIGPGGGGSLWDSTGRGSGGGIGGWQWFWRRRRHGYSGNRRWWPWDGVQVELAPGPGGSGAGIQSLGLGISGIEPTRKPGKWLAASALLRTGTSSSAPPELVLSNSVMGNSVMVRRPVRARLYRGGGRDSLGPQLVFAAWENRAKTPMRAWTRPPSSPGSAPCP